MMRNERGITVVSLVAIVVILLILTTTIVININTGEDYANYRKMCADIDTLKDRILIYYNNYGEIPKTDIKINARSISEAAGETGDFYTVDLGKLSNLTLNYGTGEGDNVYIINENSLNIYYLHGIEYEGNVVHAKQWNLPFFSNYGIILI